MLLPVTLVLVGLLLSLGQANVTVSRYDYERSRNDAALASSPAAASTGIHNESCCKISNFYLVCEFVMVPRHPEFPSMEGS